MEDFTVRAADFEILNIRPIMSIEEIKEAVKNNKIDHLLSLVKYVDGEDVDEALKIYEEYYNKEANIAKTIQDIVNKFKIRRMKHKIPNNGNYTYKLE